MATLGTRIGSFANTSNVNTYTQGVSTSNQRTITITSPSAGSYYHLTGMQIEFESDTGINGTVSALQLQTGCGSNFDWETLVLGASAPTVGNGVYTPLDLYIAPGQDLRFAYTTSRGAFAGGDITVRVGLNLIEIKNS